jgi:hypothetical protein
MEMILVGIQYSKRIFEIIPEHKQSPSDVEKISAWFFPLFLFSRFLFSPLYICIILQIFIYFEFLINEINGFGLGSMAQVVEYLPTKCESLSSNPSTAKKKKRFFHKCNSCASYKVITCFAMHTKPLISQVAWLSSE